MSRCHHHESARHQYVERYLDPSQNEPPPLHDPRHHCHRKTDEQEGFSSKTGDVCAIRALSAGGNADGESYVIGAYTHVAPTRTRGGSSISVIVYTSLYPPPPTPPKHTYTEVDFSKYDCTNLGAPQKGASYAGTVIGTSWVHQEEEDV
jgi:hypothetical protein